MIMILITVSDLWGGGGGKMLKISTFDGKLVSQSRIRKEMFYLTHFIYMSAFVTPVVEHRLEQKIGPP